MPTQYYNLVEYQGFWLVTIRFWM